MAVRATGEPVGVGDSRPAGGDGGRRRRLDRIALAAIGGVLVAALAAPAMPAGPTAPRATAQEATPTTAAADAGPAAAADLAALTLTADDLEAVGLEGFGIAGGSISTLEAAARGAAEARGGEDEPVAPYRTALLEAGWRRGVQSTLAVPRSGEPRVFDRSVSSAIDEYDDAAGAAEGFAFLNDETAYREVEVRQIRGTRSFGDETVVYRFRGAADDTGEPFQGAGLSFRLGNREASVIVYDWDGEAVAIETVNALAARLLERIEAGLGEEAGLSGSALVLDGASVDDGYANYLLRAGETFPTVGETAAEAAALQPAAARETFLVRQYVAAGNPDDLEDDAVYAVWLHRFPEATDAAAWLAGEREAAGIYAAPVVGFGEDGFAYSYAVGEGAAARRGYVGSTRAGAVGLTIEVGGPPEAPLAAFQELAAAQFACLAAADCPGFVPVPSSWTGTISAAPAVDAEATPVAGTPAP